MAVCEEVSGHSAQPLVLGVRGCGSASVGGEEVLMRSLVVLGGLCRLHLLVREDAWDAQWCLCEAHQEPRLKHREGLRPFLQ